MTHRFLSTRNIFLLCLVVSLAFLGLSRLRPASKTQEPAKVADRKAMREQIVAMHAEIELFEIEHEIDRITLFDMIKEERAILAKFESASFHKSMFHMLYNDEFLENSRVWAGAWLEIAVNNNVSDEELKNRLSENNTREHRDEFLKCFGKDLAEGFETLPKATNEEEFSRMRRQLADRFQEEIQKRATAEIRSRVAVQKKEFVRLASELAGKRLDLETLERQYREAR